MAVETVCLSAQGPGVQELAKFFAGYVVVLATPGPNLLAVAGIAALRGLREVWSLCLGIALGAGALNAALAACRIWVCRWFVGWREGQAGSRRRWSLRQL
jgi:hypothetical protein